MARGRPRRLTDWEATSTTTTVTVVLDTVVNANVMLTTAILAASGPRKTLTRMLLELGIGPGPTETGVVIVHAALVVVKADKTGGILAYDPSNSFDLEKGGVLWQRQLFFDFSTASPRAGAAFFREGIDVRAQRKLDESDQVVFFIEPNGGDIRYHIGGRALLKLA